MIPRSLVQASMNERIKKQHILLGTAFTIMLIASLLTTTAPMLVAKPLKFMALDVGRATTVITARGTPTIAFLSDGKAYLVAWISAPQENPTKGKVFGVLINPDTGKASLVIIDKNKDNTYLDAVVGGRHTFAVVYERFTPATKLDVVLAMVTSDGEVLEPAIVAQSDSYESYARVAYSCGDYLIAWYDSRDQSIYGVIYNEKGQPLKGKFLIARTREPYSLASLQVYGGDTYFLVVYRKYDGIQHGIYARKVDLDGDVSKEFKVLDDPGINEDLSECLTASQSPISSGKLFVPIVGGGNVYLVVVDANAEKVIDKYLLSMAGASPYVAVDKVTGSVAVAWTDYENDSLGDIDVAFINAAKLGKPTVYDVSTGLNGVPEWSPTIAFSNTELVVTWSGRMGEYSEVFSTVVSPSKGSLGVARLVEYEIPKIKVDGIITDLVKSWGGFLVPLTFFRSVSDHDLYLIEGNILEDIVNGTANSPSSIPTRIPLPTLKPRVITSTSTFTRIETTTFTTSKTIIINNTITTSTTLTKTTTVTVTRIKTIWAGTLTLTRVIVTTPRWTPVALGGIVVLGAVIAVLVVLLLKAKGVALPKRFLR